MVFCFLDYLQLIAVSLSSPHQLVNLSLIPSDRLIVYFETLMRFYWLGGAGMGIVMLTDIVLMDWQEN